MSDWNDDNCWPNDNGPLHSWIPDSNAKARPQIRQILINESNTDLLNLYFFVLSADGITPALDENGGQPQINITATGWNSIGVGSLVSVGFGNYYAKLTSDSINQLGVILSRYKGITTLETRGETIEVIQNYRTSNIFNDGDSPTLLAYVTLSEAEAYFNTRLNCKVWSKRNMEDKLKSLVMATIDIDQLAFQGVKTSEYRRRIREFYIPANADDPYIGLSWVRWAPLDWNWDDRRCSPNQDNDFNTDWEQQLATHCWHQKLEFPRNGSKVVPNEIKMATCEIAYQYLNKFDFELEIQSLNVIHQSFSSTRDSFDRRFVSENIRAGINSARAWILLKPFLRNPLRFRLAKVN